MESAYAMPPRSLFTHDVQIRYGQDAAGWQSLTNVAMFLLFHHLSISYT